MDQAASEIAVAAGHTADSGAAPDRAPDQVVLDLADKAEPVKPTTPHKRQDPPNFVFAPGHYLADHRTFLVPYPGLAIGDGLIGMVLARRYVQANKAAFQTAADTYRDVANLGAHH